MIWEFLQDACVSHLIGQDEMYIQQNVLIRSQDKKDQNIFLHNKFLEWDIQRAKHILQTVQVYNPIQP